MLDAILAGNRPADIDWLHVQRAANRGLTRFLAVWMIVMVWLPPFVIVGYGASPDAFRALVVAFVVGVGWLAWLLRAVFSQDRLAWRSGLLAWLGLLLGAAVIAVFAVHPISRFGLFLNTGPVAWFGLVGFVLLLLQEPRVIASLRGRLGVALVALYIIAAIYPAALSLASGTFATVPVSVSATRYVEYGIGQFGLFGAGLGRGGEGFWSLAELVGAEQVGSAPRLANAYVAMLWEGGPLLLLAFLIFALVPAGYAFFSAASRLRRLGPVSSGRRVEKTRRRRALALFGWLAVLAFLPHSFMGILAAGMLAALVLERGTAGSEDGVLRVRMLYLKKRAFLWLARALVVVALGFGVFGARRVVAMIVRPSVIDLGPRASYLSGFDHWLVARSIGASAASAAPEDASSQITQARAYYEAALLRLPRNLILAVEASQFYRLVAEDSEAASRVAEQGLAVDATYVPLALERAAQFAAAGQNEQALALLIPHAGESAAVAYRLGALSLAAGNLDQAASYYEQAIQQNPNHLQARFELTQALIALGHSSDALSQLDDLEARAAEDDFQTREVITQLRGLVE